MTIELDGSKVSPQTHVFVGMYRPPRESLTLTPSWNLRCPHCRRLWNTLGYSGEPHILLEDAISECWLAGHIDVPQWRLAE